MRLFDLFRRREHREKDYDAVLREVNKLNYTRARIYHELQGSVPRTGNYTHADLRKAERNFYRAERKLEELYGRDEAAKLNRKYDRLINRFGKEDPGVYEFEKKELGMHKHDNAKKHIGTVAGVISIVSLALASLASRNVTGNVIGNAGFLGESAVLLVIGLILGIVWLILRR